MAAVKLTPRMNDVSQFDGNMRVDLRRAVLILYHSRSEIEQITEVGLDFHRTLDVSYTSQTARCWKPSSV